MTKLSWSALVYFLCEIHSVHMKVLFQTVTNLADINEKTSRYQFVRNVIIYYYYVIVRLSYARDEMQYV